MKSAKLQIGDRILGSDRAIHITVSIPETVEEFSDTFPALLIVRWAIRGMRIWLQDAILRPMYAENPNRPASDYQDAYDELDYSKAKARGRPTTPRTVALPAGKKMFTDEEVKLLLAANRIQAVVV